MEIARREHRSLSKQVEFLLERCVDLRNIDPIPLDQTPPTDLQGKIGSNPVKKKKAKG